MRRGREGDPACLLIVVSAAQSVRSLIVNTDDVGSSLAGQDFFFCVPGTIQFDPLPRSLIGFPPVQDESRTC